MALTLGPLRKTRDTRDLETPALSATSKIVGRGRALSVVGAVELEDSAVAGSFMGLVPAGKQLERSHFIVSLRCLGPLADDPLTDAAASPDNRYRDCPTGTLPEIPRESLLTGQCDAHYILCLERSKLEKAK